MRALPPDGLQVVLSPAAAEHPDFHDGYTSIRMRRDQNVCTDPLHRMHILVTDPDERELRLVVRSHRGRVDSRALACLEAELTHATIVEARDVPSDVVTMNSWVVFKDDRAGSARRVKLVYPRDADGMGRLSVLSPLGTALLGVRTGQSVLWSSSDRRMRKLRVTAVPYQPERAGQLYGRPGGE